MNNPHEYPIDDLFRDKLENYSLEPSPTVWENISRSLEQKKRKHGILWIHTRNITTVFLIILLLIPFIGVFIRDIYKMGIKNTTNTVLINKKNNLNSNENAIHSQNNKNSLQLYDIIKTENLDKDKKNNNEFNKNNNKTLKSITIAGINKHNKTVVSKTPDKIVVKENNNNVKSGFVDNDNSTNNIDLINIDNNISNINKNEDIKDNLMLNNNVSIINNKHNLSLNESGLDFKLMTDNEKATYIPPPDDYGKRDLWNLGIHFTPEIIVNPFYSDTFTTNDNKYAYSFDITTTYRFGNMFVEGGVGLLYSLDKLNYKVEYEKLEAVGSYQEVELVTFDTIDNNLIPVYHTNTVNIYDTLRNKQLFRNHIHTVIYKFHFI